MRDIVAVRGVGFVVALGLAGLVVSGLAFMRVMPVAEPPAADGPKFELVRPVLPEPPPPPTVIKTTTVRQTQPMPDAPPQETPLPPAPEPAPFTPTVIEASPVVGPVEPIVATARPIGAPPRPVYPDRAAERGKEGAVVIRLIVGVDGQVTSAAIVSETPTGFGFGQSALAAVRRTKFEPKRIDGAATLGEFTYTVRFKLD